MDSGLGFVQPMFFIGVVEDRNDPRLEGRVRVRAFGVHGTNQDIPTDDLPWATLIIGNHDVNFTPPPLNAWVFGFFIDGRDAQQPMILGLIPAQSLSVIDPSVVGWGVQPAENYDRHMQGVRARDIGTSPVSNLATGEFLNETYNAPLEINRARDIPIAGGGAISYAPGGNANAWSDDRGEDSSVGATPRRPISASEQTRINALDNDTEFQSELRRLQQNYGVTREQVYGIIAGESSYNPSIVNRFGYAGFFQFGSAALNDINRRFGTNYTPTQISRMTPVQQLRVYDQYLQRWNYRNSSGLGIIQAAPAFANRPGNTEVYAVGSSAWRNNPGWRGADGRITVDSINAYYNRRNPPSLQGEAGQSGPELLEDPSQPDRVEESRLNEQRQSRNNRAEQIRREIAEIDAALERLGNDPQNANQRRELEEEKARLEEELRSLDPNASTESQTDEPYQGYMDSPATSGQVATWDEPASAYGAQYPFNRVIETASGHSIELDDTPGAERIMIWHQSGSYIQISTTSTTHKNMGDSYDIHERNHHVYVKGTNIMTIDGDCHVLVKGNKIEEIQGDYRQIVHGSTQMGAARSVEINGATSTDIRSASLTLDSNVENLNIRTSQNITFESGDTISFRSRNIMIGSSENTSITAQNGVFLESNQNMHLKANGNMFMNPSQNLFLRADGGSISMQSVGSIRMNADAFVSIKSASTMELKADANMSLKSDATINVMADGLLAIKSNEMFLNSGGGNLNVKSGAEMRLESDGNMNVKSGDDIFVTGSTVYVDDIVQLSSGAEATSADVKEQIEPAPYLGEFDGSDISPQADSAPEASTPPSAPSRADGPAPPPVPSIPENELTGQNPADDFSPSEQNAGLNTPSESETQPTVSSAGILPNELVQDGHMKTVVASETGGTRLYSPNIEGQQGIRDVHGASYADYASGLRPVWGSNLPSGIQPGQNNVNGMSFNAVNIPGVGWTTSDFVQASSTGTYARVAGNGTIYLPNGTTNINSIGASLPTRQQALAITGVARNRSSGVLRSFVGVNASQYNNRITIGTSSGNAALRESDRLLADQARRLRG